MITVYTDGAYSSSRDQGGWAYVIINEKDNKLFSNCDVVAKTTNNRMEIQSTIEAIKELKNRGIFELTLFSDSMYVIGTMTLNWKKKKNVDLWVELFDLCNNLKINWKHVKGHSNDKWNEYCDMLAVNASHAILNL